jgi:hypothetical protein
MLFTALGDLRDKGDTYRFNNERRFAPESSYFWYDVVLRRSDGAIRDFWFLIDDSAAQYGVLRVEYAEERGGK